MKFPRLSLTVLGFASLSQGGEIDGTNPGIQVQFHHDFVDIAKQYYFDNVPDFTYRAIEKDSLPHEFIDEDFRITEI